MIVADTSALVSLASGSVLELFLEEFDIAVSGKVMRELKELAGGMNRSSENAREILANKENLTVHTTQEEGPTSSTIDAGEASCVLLVRKLDADLMITDDYRALPEIERILGKDRVAISPIVLKALVKREVLNREEAVEKLEKISKNRDWLHRPIYRKARELLEKG